MHAFWGRYLELVQIILTEIYSNFPETEPKHRILLDVIIAFCASTVIYIYSVMVDC